MNGKNICAGLLSILMLSGCGPSSGFKFSKSNAEDPERFSSATSHSELLSEINAEVDPVPGDDPIPAPNPEPVPVETHPIQVAPQIVGQCMIGDLDIIEAVHRCQGSAPLIMTVKDQSGERVVMTYNFPAATTLGRGLPGQIGGTGLAAALSSTFPSTITGSEVDIFLCLDTNGNGQCGDERLGSLDASAQALVGRLALSQLFTCQGAMVFYHKHYSFTPGAPSTAGKAANVLAGMMRNLDDAPQTTNGTTVFRPPLVQFQNIGNCPMSDRTDGCFAKGTKIQTGKDQSVAIETLHVGFPVALANGGMATIKKIVTGPESKPMIHFITSTGQKLVVTSEHPLLTQKGIKMAKDITIGDELKTAAGKFATIASISQKPYKLNVYNIELEGDATEDHLIIAEGLVSGDLYIQNKLSTGNSKPGLLTSAHSN